MLNIDYDKLKQVIDFFAKPMWAGADPKWPWRQGGGEIYIQEILAKAQPHLTQEALRQDPKNRLLNALKVHVNLLSQYDLMYAQTFIRNKPADEIRDHILHLLYGLEELGLRLKNFLEWGRLQPIPDNKKQGFSHTASTYLLAISNPRHYPFCKPSAYNSAVSELLDRKEVRRDPVERILHCQIFYSEVLNFLEKEYGLSNGNLLDVHSMFFCFQALDDEGGSAWKKAAVPLPSDQIHIPKPPPSGNPFYDLLMARHNLVLYGPPGTGKTREALLLGRKWKEAYGPETVSQITFHPSYSYEDFIEGYRPTPDGAGFALKDGIFKIICEKAKNAPEKKFLLIVDEINRGDVARILGELITLLEGDKRGEQHQAWLLSDRPFFVPENVYVLGTMNTADKSISLMDLAVRRRFLFHYCPPDPDVLDQGRIHFDEINNLRLSGLLIGLNQRLMNVGVDRDRVLGHSFFLISRQEGDPQAALKNRFRYEIIPLVEEYCYSNRADMARVLGDLVDLQGAVNSDVLDDDERFFAALQSLSDIP